MLAPGDAVLVAVSGGPDSVALLHLLLDLAPDMQLRLGMAHLNHGLRGADSDSDAEFVRSLADRLNLPFFGRKADVEGFQKANRLSLEDASRRVRYAFFTETADANRYGKIALGHHGDDNAELVLLNLLRGSGPQGLSGIPPVREGRFIRPLIDLTRDQIETFLQDRSIPYILDASNQDLRHRRNRIRHRLLPLIRQDYNPEISHTLSRLAAIMREENQWIDDLTDSALVTCVIEDEADRLVLSNEKLRQLELPLARRVLRKALLRVKGSLRRIRFSHIESILDLMGKDSTPISPPKQVHLPDRIWIVIHPDRLIIRRSANSLRSRGVLSPSHDPLFRYTVSEPTAGSEIPIPEIGGKLRFTLLPGPGLPKEATAPTVACFDLERLRFPLSIRSPLPGDRFSPLGMTGSQKLKDFFINQKVPPGERDRCPLLITDGIIIWIAGHRTAEFAKVTRKTQKVLKVELFLA
jgi:tRNA(Ile)-lysidine synthase